MFVHAASILADGDDVVVKLIVFALVAVIWGIGALFTAVSKAVKKQSAQPARPGQPTQPRQFATPPPLPGKAGPIRSLADLQNLRNMAIRPQAETRQQRKLKESRRRAEAPRPPSAPKKPRVDPVSAPEKLVTGPPMEIARPAARPTFGGLNASTIRRQFILAEVLQPPLALREERKAVADRHNNPVR